VWGVYRSNDGGATWTRFNDDAHQYGGIGVMAADQRTYGRIYFSGTGRGLLYATKPMSFISMAGSTSAAPARPVARNQTGVVQVSLSQISSSQISKERTAVRAQSGYDNALPRLRSHDRPQPYGTERR
jgi:hypothetical protein